MHLEFTEYVKNIENMTESFIREYWNVIGDSKNEYNIETVTVLMGLLGTVL